jgi:hypothetical protein
MLATTGLLTVPTAGNAQTPGMERRQDRRSDRMGARHTRQQGRQTGREAKQDCRSAGGQPMDCRHQKQAIKRDARGAAHDIKTQD